MVIVVYAVAPYEVADRLERRGWRATHSNMHTRTMHRRFEDDERQAPSATVRRLLAGLVYSVESVP